MSARIKYVKGSLFDAPKDAILVHACNTRGVWGSGIAKEFKKRYEVAFERYRSACLRDGAVTGNTAMVRDGVAVGVGKVMGTGTRIACLLTSRDYGDKRDDVPTIKVNTALALNHLVQEYLAPGNKFASNKFNSGLFGVPWADTEEILKVFVERYNLDWTVYDPDL